MQIKLLKAYQSISWKYSTPTELCGICQQGFNQMCVNCEHPIKCVPVVGKCTHYYHMHCLKRWLENNRVCPLCRAGWKYGKLFGEKFNEL